MSGLRVEKDDEIKACMWAPVSEETKCVTVGSLPFFPLGAPDSIESDRPSFNWLRQFQQKPFFN